MNINELSPVSLKAVIANSAKVSDVVEFEHGNTLVGIFHPIVNTSTAINFEVGMSADSLVPLEDGSGADYSVTIDNTQAGYVPVDYTKFIGFRFVKLLVADNQTGAKTFNLSVRPLS